MAFCLLLPGLSPAQDVAHEPGWQSVAMQFLSAQLEERWADAAIQLVEEEREPWLSKQQWLSKKAVAVRAAWPEDVRQREADRVRRELERLAVSVLTCEKTPELGEGMHRVRIDPDGRSYRFLRMRHDAQGWGVVTHARALDAEQRRTVSAYMQAMDQGLWEEAEAWVANVSLPRFAGYRMEVEAYLNASPAVAKAFAQQAELRRDEWPEAMYSATAEGEYILVVQVEFPNATKSACELILVDDTWRILHR